MKIAKINVREDDTSTVQLKDNIDGEYCDGIEFKTSKDAKEYTKSVGCIFTLMEIEK